MIVAVVRQYGGFLLKLITATIIPGQARLRLAGIGFRYSVKQGSAAVQRLINSC
jgi:hypothetical protein